MRKTVLLIDDDDDLQDLVAVTLRPQDVHVVGATTAQAAVETLASDRFDAIVLDLGLPDARGEDLLERLGRDYPHTPVLVLSAAGEVERVVRCMQLGAIDFVAKPFDSLRLRTSVANAVEQGRLRAKVEDLADQRRRGEGLGALIGNSPRMRAAIALLGRCSMSDVTLLITGESGTGKEVAARAVHAESRRRDGPFVAINCGAIPEGIIESELFGHEKGAFTGAIAARRGCFEEADGGTLLLDEIGELRPELQVRLLRVLQERVVQRVGAARPRAIDVRIVAATNKDLAAMVTAGTFRQDLYYRLAVFPVHMPPLRERENDVLLLTQRFVERIARTYGKAIQGVSQEFAQALRAHSWPGNVRELENLIERAVILEDGAMLSVAALPPELQSSTATASPAAGASAAPPAATALAVLTGAGAGSMRPRTAEEVQPFDVQEQRIVEEALIACGWNIREAARRLGIGRATIYRKLERYGLARGLNLVDDEATGDDELRRAR